MLKKMNKSMSRSRSRNMHKNRGRCILNIRIRSITRKMSIIRRNRTFHLEDYLWALKFWCPITIMFPSGSLTLSLEIGRVEEVGGLGVGVDLEAGAVTSSKSGSAKEVSYSGLM